MNKKIISLAIAAMLGVTAASSVLAATIYPKCGSTNDPLFGGPYASVEFGTGTTTGSTFSTPGIFLGITCSKTATPPSLNQLQDINAPKQSIATMAQIAGKSAIPPVNQYTLNIPTGGGSGNLSLLNKTNLNCPQGYKSELVTFNYRDSADSASNIKHSPCLIGLDSRTKQTDPHLTWSYDSATHVGVFHYATS